MISCFLLNATEWEISAGNFYYSPSVLEIVVGDNVTWINDGGYHDVNGTVNAVTGFVYDNPELFILPPTSGSIMGSYTFTIPGTYNYNCSVGSHAANGQTGIIIVVDSSSDIDGCTDANAIACGDDIDTLYFPECDTCSDDNPCDNYYNPNATIDNGLCMYNDIPGYDEFSIDLGLEEGSLDLDWSLFNPPVEVSQYVLMRCADIDGDNDNDGEFEYEMCVMIIPPMPMFTGSQFNYWGSLFIAYGYISLIMVFTQSDNYNTIKKHLASIGQMALTNYILHSFIGVLIFFGIGFGLFGKIDRSLQMLIVSAIWIFQYFASEKWLNFYKFGPLEWVWRSLTYGKKQPFIRS